jgi:hypothetical protein
MTARFNSEILAARADIVAPPALRACEDHSFEMPTGIYAAMAVLFFGFVSVLSFAFMGPTMVVPYGTCMIFIAAFFAVPVLFVRTGPGEAHVKKALDWYEFREKGIATATGRSSAAEATTLALLLPFLILCWAIALATIAALV